MGLAARMPGGESFLHQERAIFDHLFDVALQGAQLLRPRMLLVNALENQARRRPDIVREYLEKLALLQERHALPPGVGSELVAKGVADGERESEGGIGAVNRLHEAIRRLAARRRIPGRRQLGVRPAHLLVDHVARRRRTTAGRRSFTNEELLAAIIFEVIQLGFLAWFLRVRGWTLEKFGLAFSWQRHGVGLVLLVVTYVLDAGRAVARAGRLRLRHAGRHRARAQGRRRPEHAARVPGLDGQRHLRRGVRRRLHHHRADSRGAGMWIAINVSTVVRLLYHLYQGPIGVITIVPMGLLYGYLYARTRQLWPLIVAHVLLDIIGLIVWAAARNGVRPRVLSGDLTARR